MGTLAKIRRLHLREGVPIKEIERRTGFARNTIKSWLRRGQMDEPKYPPRVVAAKLDGYTEQLAMSLKADAHRGKRERRTIKQMYEELAAQGYLGGYGRVGKSAFVPVKFVMGEVFQFNWSTEYAFVGGLRRRLDVVQTMLRANQAFRQQPILPYDVDTSSSNLGRQPEHPYAHIVGHLQEFRPSLSLTNSSLTAPARCA